MALWGACRTKYLPTGDISGGDLRLEITLANVSDGVVTTGRTSTGIFGCTIDKSSLKTLFSIFRLQANIGLASAKTVSQRANPINDAGQWYYSIGGKHVPSNPVKSNVEAFAKLS